MKIKTEKYIKVQIEIEGKDVETFTNILESVRIFMEDKRKIQSLFGSDGFYKMRVMLTELFDKLS